MNPITRKIRNKGYTLKQFCEKIGYSLRWYRTHASPLSPKYKELEKIVDSLKPNSK